MSLLLDTHVLLWWVLGDESLSETAKKVISDTSVDRFVSAVSGFEINNKIRVGKFDAGRNVFEDLSEIIRDNGWRTLPLSLQHAELAGRLGGDHRDPFDRFLAAQAIVEDLKVVTVDQRIAELGAKVLW